MIDYLAYQQGVVSPLQKAMQGYQLGQQRRQQQEARALEAQKLQQQQQMKSDLSEFAAMENKTPKDYEQFILKYPSLSEALDEPLKRMEQGRKEAYQKDALNIYMALDGGQTEFASKLINRKMEEAQNAGNQADVDTFKALGLILEQSPESAKDTAGFYLSKLMGGEKFADSYAKIKETQRDEELQEGILAKQAADLGLTNQKIAESLAKTKGLELEARKIDLELQKAKEDTGEVPREKRFEAEQKLRDEYFKKTKNFRDVNEAFQRIDAAQDNAAGDLSLIFAYMKMLDPGSTVREGEFATAQNAAGVPERIQNTYNQILRGERLNPKQRKQFKGQAGGLFNAALKREKEVRKGLQGIAKRGGLNEDNIFLTSPVEDVEVIEVKDEKKQLKPEQTGFIDSLMNRFQ